MEFENYVIHVLNEKGAIAEKRSIRRISPDEGERRELIDSMAGIGIAHCVYLAMKSSEDFLDRVYFYSIQSCEEALPAVLHGPGVILANFYGSLEEEFIEDDF